MVTTQEGDQHGALPPGRRGRTAGRGRRPAHGSTAPLSVDVPCKLKLISHSYMRRVPGGTYLLGVATPGKHEKEALRELERFLHSLQFE